LDSVNYFFENEILCCLNLMIDNVPQYIFLKLLLYFLFLFLILYFYSAFVLGLDLGLS